MQEKSILITGASGEIGQALIESLAESSAYHLVSLDLSPLPASLEDQSTHIVGNILDKDLLTDLAAEHRFHTIYHLAAMLSTTGEHKPLLAHQVNTGGTLDLLDIAADQSQRWNESVKFIFPSSIAVYGLPDLETKQEYFRIQEDQWTNPTTMYGCTKLYCEKVGSYFSEHYLQLDEEQPTRLDFRALRFPGLISAFTVPSGGTSDYGPEMIHAAAQGQPYDCFVRPEVRIPFMVMPDAVRSLLVLAQAPAENLSRRVYNVTSFSLSARGFSEMVAEAFPKAEIRFTPDEKRQAIVDSWPADLDDSAARQDWGWEPQYDASRACHDYLLPNIRQRYS
jgi:nucleoside-diphosphate-sugar epimerase